MKRNPSTAGVRARTTTTLLATVLLLTTAAGALAAVSPEAAALIDRHVAWLGGWESVDGLRDLSLEGAIEVAGLKGSLSVQMRRDGRQRTAFDLKVISGTEAVDGDQAWERNASGQVEDMGREKRADLSRGLDRAFGHHFHGQGVEVTVLPDETKDDRAWSVLRFAYPDGDLHDLLVDAATGESIWSRNTTDGRARWTRLSDFRQVDGRRLAFRQETLDVQPIHNQTVTWTTVAVDKGLGDDLFRRPGVAPEERLFRLPPGVTTTAWLPIELHYNRYIYLQGSVDGVKTDVLLDSGAGMTVLDTAMAGRLGRESKGALPAEGVGGTTTAGLVEGVTVELGGLTLGPLVAATLDFSDIARQMGRGLPVVLGKELFHALVVDLDYPNARIRFIDPAAFSYDGPGRRCELLPGDDGHKRLRMAVEGLPEAIFALDTGQGAALTVFRKYADDNHLLDGRRTTTAVGGGVGGSTDLLTARLKKVSLAGYELDDVPTSFHRHDVGGAFDTAKLAGNVGAGILARFRVIFDYPHGCLWLEPGKDFGAPQARDKIGLSVEREEGVLVVRHVAAGSPAETAGWKTGERIAALDGKPVDADWWKVWSVWAHTPAGLEVALTMADGTVRKLTQADFY